MVNSSICSRLRDTHEEIGRAAQINESNCPQDNALAQASWTAINGLNSADLVELNRFATFCLAGVGLSTALSEDLVQDALLGILKGLAHPQRGRHPRPSDTRTPVDFRNYIKGVIRSLVDGKRRGSSRGFWVDVDPEQATESAQALDPDPGNRLAMRDLANQLFKKMRVAPRMKPVLEFWAEHWEEHEKIPLLGRHRRCRTELRALAAKAYRQLQ